MTLTEAMEFIHAASWLGSRPGLERITELMDRLDHPERTVPYIHVAGTNGKGSVCAMLASILQAAGYRTGLFTSPHLLRYNERIQINGQEISDQDLIAAAQAIRPAVEAMEDVPTEFERFTAMALVHFAKSRCDIVLLEVGMGGRLDATNVIPPPIAAVITSIGLDHTEYLGNTLAAIAGEKAGIIKRGTETVLAAQSPEAEAVIREACEKAGAALTVTDLSLLCRQSGDLSGQVLDYRRRKSLRLGLLGTYQCQNAALVLDTVDVLYRKGWMIPLDAIRLGLAAVRWPGRFEILSQEPLVLVDGAHNPQGADALADCIETYLPGRKLLFVMGVLSDKDYPSMLDVLCPLAKRIFTVTPDSPRALPAEALAEAVQARGIAAQAAGSVSEGIRQALDACGPEDVLCICGSLYQTGEARQLFGKP